MLHRRSQFDFEHTCGIEYDFFLAKGHIETT